jgi:Fe-S cluster biogenesis protein NfuA
MSTRDASGGATNLAVLDALDAEVRPFLRLHGGDCELAGVDDGVVTIRFLMACTACKLRPMTLLAAVRPRLLEVPGVKEVKALGVGVSAAAIHRADLAFGRVDNSTCA